jgi:hypothetical protein
MIDLTMSAQPTDESCGPTCLHAVYQYYGINISRDEVVKTTERSLSGGTLAPMLGKHALNMGFKATLYIYNILVFDPSWFDPTQYSKELVMDKLNLQMEYKPDIYTTKDSNAMLDFLSLGGELKFQTLSVELLKPWFARGTPIITGLSSTYLYRTPRERFSKEGQSIYDDIRGTPCGHFVVLCGYDSSKRHIMVADPYSKSPLSTNHYYSVSSKRLINAIMLGVITYDANLLIIEPRIASD